MSGNFTKRPWMRQHKGLTYIGREATRTRTPAYFTDAISLMGPHALSIATIIAMNSSAAAELAGAFQWLRK